MFGWEIVGERKKGGNRQEKLQSFPSTLHGQEIYSLDSELLLLVKFSRLKVLILFFPIWEIDSN